MVNNQPAFLALLAVKMPLLSFRKSVAGGRLDGEPVPCDCAFVLSRYFHGEAFGDKPITKNDHYTQRQRVAELFGYQMWAADFISGGSTESGLAQTKRGQGAALHRGLQLS